MRGSSFRCLRERLLQSATVSYNSVLTFPPLFCGMLRRSRCVQIFFLTNNTTTEVIHHWRLELGCRTGQHPISLRCCTLSLFNSRLLFSSSLQRSSGTLPPTQLMVYKFYLLWLLRDLIKEEKDWPDNGGR